jgi:DNA modification methylase
MLLIFAILCYIKSDTLPLGKQGSKKWIGSDAENDLRELKMDRGQKENNRKEMESVVNEYKILRGS